jgi:hypothetical protein
LRTKSDVELKKLITTEILKRYIEPAVAKMGITFDVGLMKTICCMMAVSIGRFSGCAKKACV